ncbi:MAG: dihydrodipicolinate synthase family protein [Planctomycetaceae bacterium]
MTNTLRGIVTVLNVPFTADDSIDLSGLQRNVQNAMDAGVAGFLVPAMASEVDHLSLAEKRDIVSLVVSESKKGQTVVIGGASAQARERRLYLAREFVELGCDGVLVQMDAQTDPDVIERELAEISALKPELLMVQDWDSTGSGIPVSTIVRLFERVERFNWLKIEVNAAGPKYSEVLKATNGELNVAGGWAVTKMIDGLDRGVHAFMPTGMHLIYVEIHRRYATGDRAGATELFERIQPVLAFSNQSLEISIRFFKRLLHAQGVYATADVRIGGKPLNTDQEEVANKLISNVTQIEDRLSALQGRS